MSKLNTFAAVLKFINGKNTGADSLRAVCDYTTDTAKTMDGTLIATQGCSPEHPVEDMLANKRLHNKTHGEGFYYTFDENENIVLSALKFLCWRDPSNIDDDEIGLADY